MKKFLLGFILTFPILVGSILIFNLLIDPYDLFHIISISGFNSVKPQVASYLRMQKAHKVEFLQPTAIILGSSRSEMAMNPDHPVFKRTGYKAYNMAMAGSGLYEMYRTLQHSYYASKKKLKLAIIELDIFMFNANREKVVFGTEVLGFNEDRLILSSKDSYLKKLLLDADDIFFERALRASWKTILNQHSQELYQANGMRNQKRCMLATEIPMLGHRAEFIRNEKYYMEKVWTAGLEQRYCTVSLEDKKSTFATLRQMVEFAQKHNIELRFFISPTHVRNILALQEAGLWNAFAEVKRAIVKLTKPFSVWDFMNFNSITTEKVPPLRDKKAKMHWYWEMSHFKKTTGDLVLDRIFDYKDSISVPRDFGVLLTTKNVESELAKTLQNSQHYTKQFPTDFAEIQQSAKDVFSHRAGSFCTKAYRLYYAANKIWEAGDKPKAMRLLRQAFAQQKKDQHKTMLAHLPYRELRLATLIKRSLAGYKMEKPLSSWIAYQDRGRDEIKQAKYEEAIADFSEAIDRSPQNNALYFLRGNTFLTIKHYSEAIKDFKTILQSDSKNVTVKFLLAQAKAAQHKHIQ